MGYFNSSSFVCQLLSVPAGKHDDGRANIKCVGGLVTPVNLKRFSKVMEISSIIRSTTNNKEIYSSNNTGKQGTELCDETPESKMYVCDIDRDY